MGLTHCIAMKAINQLLVHLMIYIFKNWVILHDDIEGVIFPSGKAMKRIFMENEK